MYLRDLSSGETAVSSEGGNSIHANRFRQTINLIDVSECTVALNREYANRPGTGVQGEHVLTVTTDSDVRVGASFRIRTDDGPSDGRKCAAWADGKPGNRG
jgi:hypothetical protein